MHGTRDTSEAATTDEGKLDPRQAAELLEQTTRRAQRQLEIRTPLLMLIGAAVVVFAYGVLWLSVRNQHPYSGPSGTALAVMYTTLIGWVVVVATFARRARSGVGGRSSRQQGIEGAVFATIWTSVYVFQGGAPPRRRQPCDRLRHLPGGSATDHRRLSRGSPCGRTRRLALAELRNRRGRPRRAGRVRGPGRRLGCRGYRPRRAAPRLRGHHGLAAAGMTVPPA